MAAPRTLLLTRPRAEAQAFAAVLETRLPGRFQPVIAPVLEIAPLPAAIDLDAVAALIFTSANGVAQFSARTSRRDLPAFCVGDITAGAARAEGMQAISADGDVVALAALITAQLRPADGMLLHIRGRHAAGDLAGMLTAAGFAVRATVVYDQRACQIAGPARDLLAAGSADIITHFSPRSAHVFAGQAAAEGWPLGATTSLALSAAADVEVAGLGFGRRLVTAAPTREAMVTALAEV